MIPNCILDTKYKIPLNEGLIGKTKKNFELIITRYNENITWSDNYKEFRTVYNKGSDVDYECINRPNIGRDGETILYHIINNWDNLSETTFFCQGSINDRNDQILTINDFNNYINCKDIYYFKKRSDLPNKHDNFINFPKKFGEIYYELFQHDYNKNFAWVSGMWISVNKKIIKNVPLEIYTNMLNLFEKYYLNNDPTCRILACHCERLILHVFELYNKNI
jgi:hypothetical protein